MITPHKPCAKYNYDNKCYRHLCISHKIIIFVRMKDKIIQALCRCPLFAEMEPFEIEMTLSGIDYRVVHYNKHDVYALAGMPCKHADIVVSGELVCRMVSLSGKQVEVSRLREGNLVAPAFIFAKDNSMIVSVETEGETEVLRMLPSTLLQLFDCDDKIRMNFIRVLSNINVFLTHKMKVLSLFTVREKVTYMLLEQAGRQGTDVIKLDKSRQEIADSFGIQKYSLLRVLAEFAKNRAIDIEGKTITILDRRKMK